MCKERGTFQVLLAVFCLPGVVAAERISNFDAIYTVQADGTVQVREVIEYDFESESRHGIFRTLETDHPQPATRWLHNRMIDIEVLRITQDGRNARYERTDDAGEVTLKIGDPNTYVTGAHEYVIEYILRGALSYGTKGAEFYYNVTGNGWQVPITNATAVVIGMTPDVLVSKSSCYVGGEGDTTVCPDITANSDGGTIFSSGSLSYGSGLTIAQQVNPLAVAELVVQRLSISWVLWPMSLIWLVGLSVWAWRFRRRNQSARPVVAQYEPYENFLPMYTGVLFDNALDPHDVTAGILYLAEQGYISIKRTEEKVLWIFETTEYELTLKRPIETIPTLFLQDIARILFGLGASVPVSVPLSSLRKQASENSKIIIALQASIQKDLVANGFIEGNTVKVSAAVLVRLLVPALFVLTASLFLSAMFDIGGFIPLLLAASGSIFILVFALTNRRTKKGYEALNHLEGFKLFLSVTDAERFAFHNAPDKSPEVFMKYLPYAIALKVEKEWAKVFEGITIPNPDWYDGGSVGAFSAAAFTSDMSAFSTSFSSSSGTSGSSGGGSSGGGGGSW